MGAMQEKLLMIIAEHAHLLAENAHMKSQLADSSAGTAVEGDVNWSMVDGEDVVDPKMVACKRID